MATKKAARQQAIVLPKLMTFRLSRLQARSNAQAAKLLKEKAGISLSEWRMFVMIETHGEVSPSQIVKIAELDKALVSRAVKGMQKKGLISLEVSDQDARSFVIDFTQKGLSVFEKAKPAMRMRQKLFREALTPEELETLFRVFDKLDVALDDMEKKL